MPLSPPPDYTRVFLVLALGASVVLLVAVFSRSTLPHVGDNIHHLPHGGLYRDGTKVIAYNSPHKLNSLERSQPFFKQPWTIVIILVAVIWGLSSNRERVCVNCGRVH